MTTAAPASAAPSVHEIQGIFEVEGEILSPYINHDLAPARLRDRKWAMKDIAALWISMCACVPTYMLASSLIAEGMSWWQAVLTIFLGNCVVLAPMVLNAHAGTKYGIPFPVYCRPAFGIAGANVPAVLRALVACGWFGIQTWIGGDAIYKVLSLFFHGWAILPSSAKQLAELVKAGVAVAPLDAWMATSLGLNLPELACFLLFWSINMLVIYRGIDSIRVLLNIKAPLLLGLGLILLYWAYSNAGGFGPMLDKPSLFAAGQAKEGQLWSFFFPALTGMIGFWATLSLNIPDFSRYAYSQRDQVVGQAIGLPTTMGLFSFIGVAVTSATPVIYGETIWDPLELVTRFPSVAVRVVALLSLAVATLATNIAANVVSPANDFANVWPRKISFRIGGYITGVIGILIQPWRLLADPSQYIFTWLGGYSALLGAIGGVLICDYYLVRKTRLDLVGLYRREGPYWYAGGWNPKALVALAAGILPNLPGFLGITRLAKVPAFWTSLYSYAWFVGFGISFAVYAALTTAARPDSPAQPIAEDGG
jgi:nucleobase:cation symporter-1, NCS1 family